MARFQKGQSGNPGGKPKGAVGLVKRTLNELLKGIADDPDYQESLRARAIAGDATLDKEILARVCGPVPKVHTLDVPKPLVIDVVFGPERDEPAG